jgi:hypothetical protein
MRNVKWFFRRLKRVWDFLPIIWKGYDFDYSHAINLFKYQLERTADFMESDKVMTVDADIRAKRIRTAIELLQKVYDEDYGCEYQTKMKELYGSTILDFWFEDTGKGDGSSYLRQAWEFRADSSDVEKVFDKLFKESQEKQKRAEKLVWEFISHNIRGWWD